MTASASARRASFAAGLLGLFILPLVGCHHKPSRVSYQPPPAYSGGSHRHGSTRPATRPSTRAGTRPAEPDLSADIPSQPPRPHDDLSGPPIFVEVGLASWYGPNFNHRAAADGTLYDKNALTAAHRTLPMGSTVRVTNLTTGQQVVVRITDRGPFVRGRIMDLSEGAARAVGVYRAGVARVRIEAFRHASPDPLGRWCVQTGPFTTERDATDLKRALIARYQGARVAEFSGPTGFWVRIDPADHARKDALAIQDWIGNPDPQAVPYLVRID